ncbi:MAG: short-chain dehydrogenase [Microbacterium sp.]|uniref:SDR family NAD(P)-dependent oxidoreductase n=1 Tax=Microbacterium aquimaris TaxID=459816 RepID=UPI000C8E9127|nr:SDR family NAD(P)-dependent oxidoreductase [Microbacterium aquimaris]MAP62516.1 short-chain dehydrogenase [Microbacterium sp.]MDZ8276949.1 SDR family NAD(P)-dependent oxidoreductase [Microbacterium aquimaris]
MNPRRFEGSRVIVTGAARGIGARIAERFADEGARVVVIDRLRDEGSARADAIGGTFVQADLASVDSTREAMEQAVAALGGVDALVNNAGLLRFASLMETTPEAWDETFAVNSRSMLLTLQIAAREMVAAGNGGAIVNLASMAAKTGGAGQVAYAASKSAVVALTRVAALELGPSGIRVNAMCPGYVLTEMGADTRTPEKVAQWSSYSPLGRLGEPDDVAGLALFLASPDGAYLTGQAVNITGGMVMH